MDDSANLSELAIGIKNGAIGVTTNPFLVGQTISNKADWAEKLDVIDKNLIGDEKVEAIMKVVLMEIAGRLPEQGNDKVVHGVCAQTNPSHPGKADFMLNKPKDMRNGVRKLRLSYLRREQESKWRKYVFLKDIM